jgi:rubrerythrin
MNNEEIKVVKQAIISEVEGYEFYKMASEQSAFSEVKDTFLKLAEEELKHIEWLKAMFHSFMENKEEAYKLSNLLDVPSSNIFKWSNLDRDGAQKALSVFGISIQMERAAVAFYKKASEETSSEGAKMLYVKLSNWEKIHLDQFSIEYDKLMEDWWSDQEYAPF